MKCRFCSFVGSSQEVLLKHHRLQHRRGFHWPCVHSDCICTFKTQGALRSHLSRSHNRTVKRQEILLYFCELCEFKEICSQSNFISHLLRHIKNKEAVCCPFKQCNYTTNNSKTFAAHISKKHRNSKDIKNCTGVSSQATFCNSPNWTVNSPDEAEALQSSSNLVLNYDEDNDSVNYESVEHKIASLFLCMQTLLC